MIEGSMDDIDHTSSGNQDDMDTSDVPGSQGTQKIYEKEAKIKVDYSELSDDIKDVSNIYLFYYFVLLHFSPLLLRGAFIGINTVIPNFFAFGTLSLFFLYC